MTHASEMHYDDTSPIVLTYNPGCHFNKWGIHGIFHVQENPSKLSSLNYGISLNVNFQVLSKMKRRLLESEG